MIMKMLLWIVKVIAYLALVRLVQAIIGFVRECIASKKAERRLTEAMAKTAKSMERVANRAAR